MMTTMYSDQSGKVYKILPFGSYYYVLTPSPIRGGIFPNADFKGTGMALAGVMKKGERIEDFLTRKKKKKDGN
jgi:hypothetical protein